MKQPVTISTKAGAVVSVIRNYSGAFPRISTLKRHMAKAGKGATITQKDEDGFTFHYAIVQDRRTRGAYRKERIVTLN